jgi:signal transduction histidine kinase
VTAWLTVAVWCLTAGLLRARDRRRLALAARARHEVRGPLCTARLALDGLERSARVEAIDLELRRAALALEDLGGGPHRPGGRAEPVDVGRLLREAQPAWTALAAAHGATLTIEPPRGDVHVMADPLRLLQACANLVSNAAEHGGRTTAATAGTASDAGGDVKVSPDPGTGGDRPIAVAAGAGGDRPVAVAAGAGGDITASAAAAPGGLVLIEVADGGPGLPAPLPVLLTAARGRRSPRGHGLAIAAGIAARHGGRLSAAPAAQGARLVLELPAARPATARRRASGAPA